MKKINLDTPVAMTEGGLLVTLWRSIIKENGLLGALPTLIDNYVTKLNRERLAENKKQTTSRMIDIVNSSEMTWKTFINLINNLVNYKNIKIVINVKFPNGQYTAHTIKIKDDTTEKSLDVKVMIPPITKAPIKK